MNRRPDIQTLRGVSVILVVLYHLGLPGFSGGFLGVDAFFVISGFLMAILYRESQYVDFYKRRAARLLPAYFLTIVATLAASTWLTLPSEHAQTVEQAVFATFFMSNIGFWLQTTYFSKAEFTPLLHLWSLGVEIQFYAVFPLVFWLNRKSKLAVLALAMVSAIVAFMLISFSAKTSFYMMPTRLWQFLTGSMIAWNFCRDGQPKIGRSSIGLVMFVLLISVPLVFPVDGEVKSFVFGHPGLASLLVTILCGCILAFGLPSSFTRSIFGSGLAKIGDWSYSIYLAHFPVIVFGLYQPFSGTILKSNGWEQLLLLCVLIAFFSAALQFLTDGRDLWPKRVVPAGLVLMATFAAAIASSSVSRSMLTQNELNITDARTDRAPFRCGQMIRILDPTALMCNISVAKNGERPGVLLVGDSHSDAIKVAFAQAAEEQGYSSFLTVSNLPVIGSPQGSSILEAAKAAGIEYIFIHFASGHAESVFKTDFQHEAVKLGFKVVWLLPVPIFEDEVPRTVWGQRNSKEPSAEPVNRSTVAELADGLGGQDIIVADPWPILCAKSCRIATNDLRPLYFDTNHLTLSGAELLKGVIAQALGS